MKTFKTCATRLLSSLSGIILIMSLSVAPISLAEAATYYVAKNGSDTNNGADTNPWLTVQRGVGALNAGDTLIIREGIYNETMTVSRSGTENNYITIKGENGAILDGTGINASGGRSNNMVYLNNRSYVRIENIEIRNNYSRNSGWNTNTGICVEADGGSGSAGVQLVNNKVYNIDGESFHYQSTSAGGPGGHGIAVYGYGSTEDRAVRNLLIEGNEVYNCRLGWSEAVVVNGNVKDWKIINNYVHDNNNIGIDAIGGESTSSNRTLDRARDGIISGNVIINNTGHGNIGYSYGGGAGGIYIDGGKDIRIENNYIFGSDYGIEIGTENSTDFRPSGITILNNVVAYNETACILVGGVNGAGVNGEDGIYIENNTFYNPDSVCVEWASNSNNLAGAIFLQGNIMISSGSQSYASGNGGTATRYGAGNVYYGRTSGKPGNDQLGYQYTNSSILPVPNLESGDFTLTGANLPPSHPNAGANLNMQAELLKKAINNYTARRLILPIRTSVVNTINSNKGSTSRPLTLANVGGNLCRYFEGLQAHGAKVYMKFANTDNSTFIDNDNANRYYGMVTVGQGADGRINYDKISQMRTISNIRIYVSVPYEANGQISWIEQQINNACVTFDPAFEGVTKLKASFYGRAMPSAANIENLMVKWISGNAVIAEETVTADQNGEAEIVLPSQNSGLTIWVKGERTIAVSQYIGTVEKGSVINIGTLPGGDSNGDNIVDLNDFNAFLNNYGMNSNSPGFNRFADFNNDGIVDLNDFNIFLNNYGKTGAQLPGGYFSSKTYSNEKSEELSVNNSNSNRGCNAGMIGFALLMPVLPLFSKTGRPETVPYL